jgi:hypothetical protein
MLRIEHTGRLATHRHTSYASLLFLALVAFAILLCLSVTALAAPPAVNPQSGSVGLTGVVRGPAPSTAAVILAPRGGSRTTTSPITVSGTCPARDFVSITKNNLFAGVVQCQDDGSFSLLVDLFGGSNALVAKVSDALGQYGPDSAPVTVYFDAPTFNLPGGSVGKPLFLEMPTSVVAANPGDSVSRTASIVGGVGPYAVSWDFGDGATQLQSVAAEGPVSASHSYERPGTYTVILRVTDSQSNTAFLQFVTVINGAAAAVGVTKGGGLGALSGDLVAAWPVVLLVLAMVIFFWLGERREYHKLRVRHLLA